MTVTRELIDLITREVLNAMDEKGSGTDPSMVVAGVSNRHVHLSQEDVDTLFGKGYELTKLRDLRQPGQYACKETISVASGGGVLEKVRILGPTRKKSQFELSSSDARKLRIDAPLVKSGSGVSSPPVVLVGPAGYVTLDRDSGLAYRHVHLSPSEAATLGLKDGDEIDVEAGGERGVTFRKVWVRVGPNMVSEFHVDVDEANSCGLRNGDMVRLVIK
jgi:putative phosphotransacetylase